MQRTKHNTRLVVTGGPAKGMPTTRMPPARCSRVTSCVPDALPPTAARLAPTPLAPAVAARRPRVPGLRAHVLPARLAALAGPQSSDQEAEVRAGKGGGGAPRACMSPQEQSAANKPAQGASPLHRFFACPAACATPPWPPPPAGTRRSARRRWPRPPSTCARASPPSLWCSSSTCARCALTTSPTTHTCASSSATCLCARVRRGVAEPQPPPCCARGLSGLCVRTGASPLFGGRMLLPEGLPGGRMRGWPGRRQAKWSELSNGSAPPA